MRAIVMRGFGSPTEAEFAEVPKPLCGPDDVLIRVAASGINPVDWKECEGLLQPFYATYPDPWIVGYDAAGIAEEVGENVTDIAAGDRVVAFSDRRDNGHNGTFAEYVKVASDAVGRLPNSITFTEAAAIPCAGLTGYQAMFRHDKGGLQSGDTVLIHGASGGVGSYDVQFAKAAGLRVAATCSGRNVDYVRGLGADLVLDYTQGGLVAGLRKFAPDGLAAIIDCVGGDSFPDSFDALKPGGRLINIATLTQDGDIEADAKAAAALGFVRIFSIMNFDRLGDQLGLITDLLAQGKVVSPQLTTYPFAAGAAALQAMKQGGNRGKLVLSIADLD